MICAIFYFLYFAAIGIYTPYWTLYLRDLQLSPMQIAVVCSIPSGARTLLPPLFGYIADRFRARRHFLILSCLAQVLPLALLIYLRSYAWLLVLVTIFAFCNSAVLSFTEATVQEDQEKGRLDYGRTRLWGTISFILLAVGFGFLLDTHNTNWVLYGFQFFLILLSAASFLMPEGKVQFRLQHDHLKEAMANPATGLFLLCVFLMHLSHGTFYGFFSIYLSDLGYSDSGIGLQWAVAATSELSIFYFASRIQRRFESPALLSVCFVAATARWFLTGTIGSFWWITAFQCLHAFTFGLFHVTSMRMVHRLFPEGSRSFGQALYTSISGGFGSVAGVLISGRLWEQLGGRAFYVSGAMTLAGFCFSILLTTHKGRDGTLREVM